MAEQPQIIFMIGDIVKAKVGFMMFEGVVVGNGQPDVLEVDFGDAIEEIPVMDCALVMNGLDFEIGDFVSASPIGDLYFNGQIVNINSNGTFDIHFEGDDEDEIETQIRPERVRKLRTGRQLVLSRWHRAKSMISASIAFSNMKSTVSSRSESKVALEETKEELDEEP